MLAYQLKNPSQYQTKPQSTLAQLKSRYIDYCDSQQQMKIYWYMKAIILLTCVFMVPSIIAMAMATDLYVYYVGFTMVLFYTNVLAHITGLSSKYFVPIYHLTCLTMVLVPLLTILIGGMNGTYMTL